MNTDEDSSFSQQSMSSPLVFDFVRNKSYLPPLTDSNGFGTAEYDHQINTSRKISINHVFKSMIIQELKTLRHVGELERSQVPTIFAMSVQIPQLAGYLLT